MGLKHLPSKTLSSHSVYKYITDISVVRTFLRDAMRPFIPLFFTMGSQMGDNLPGRGDESEDGISLGIKGLECRLFSMGVRQSPGPPITTAQRLNK